MQSSQPLQIFLAFCGGAIALAISAPLPALQQHSSKRPEHVVALRAIYLVRETGELSPADMKAHPEIAVVHTWADFQKQAAQQKVTLWIDKGAVSLVEEPWLHQEPQKWYPLVLLGYNDALYAFREVLTGFGIEGPAVDWSQRKVEPGFSLWKLQTETPTGRSATLRGFQVKPGVQAILQSTTSWMDSHPSE